MVPPRPSRILAGLGLRAELDRVGVLKVLDAFAAPPSGPEAAAALVERARGLLPGGLRVPKVCQSFAELGPGAFLKATHAGGGVGVHPAALFSSSRGSPTSLSPAGARSGRP